MNAFKRDLVILRGLPSWRRTLTLVAYVLFGSTVVWSFVLALVDHVDTDELLLVDVVMFGIAIASLIVARGFNQVPKPEMTDVASPSADEDRVTAERAAWHKKFTTST